MPQRWCQCRGCSSCRKTTGTCGIVFNADVTRGTKCPGCKAIATAKRQQRTSSTSRGYGTEHRKLRDKLLEQFEPGQPCVLCHQPMPSADNLDLAHNETRTGWKGLAHARCNRNTGNTGRNAAR